MTDFCLTCQIFNGQELQTVKFIERFMEKPVFVKKKKKKKKKKLFRLNMSLSQWDWIKKSLKWKHTDSLVKKVLVAASVKKVLLIVFCNMKGSIIIDFFGKVQF